MNPLQARYAAVDPDVVRVLSIRRKDGQALKGFVGSALVTREFMRDASESLLFELDQRDPDRGSTEDA